MVKFFIEPEYDVKMPQREFGNGGIDVYVPGYTERFIEDFKNKNLSTCAEIVQDEKTSEYSIYVYPHKDVNIPTGLRSRISANIALEAHNKSGIATKYGLVFGASTVDASYQGIIHISLINTTNKTIELPLGMKAVQFIPRIIDISEITVYDNMSFDEFYKDFEHTNRGEGAFGSTGV
jgi:dUTPase